MRDHDHTAAKVREGFFEPCDRRQIEVVGRFVEQQDVGIGEQQLCQLDAHQPAAAERTQRPAAVVGLEAGEPGTRSTRASRSNRRPDRSDGACGRSAQPDRRHVVPPAQWAIIVFEGARLVGIASRCAGHQRYSRTLRGRVGSISDTHRCDAARATHSPYPPDRGRPRCATAWSYRHRWGPRGRSGRRHAHRATRPRRRAATE